MVGVVPINIQITPNLYMKFNAMVEGGVRLGFKYEYKNKFKIGVRYENGEWDGIKSFEEIKNDFNFEKPQAYFTANAGIGLFFGLDVMLYGVAGPEMGVGPSLDAKATLTVKNNRTDWQDTDWTKDVEFKGSVGLSIKAYVGAKVSFLGYELGHWSTDINLIEPWILKKYPSDGTEHKSPEQKEKESNLSIIQQLMDHIYKTDSLLKKDCETAIFQVMQKNNADRTEGVELYSSKLTHWSKGFNLCTVYDWFIEKNNRKPQMNANDLQEIMEMLPNYSKTLYQKMERHFKPHYDFLKAYANSTATNASPQLKEQAIYETIFSYFITKRKANLPDSEKPGLEGNLPLSVVKMSEMERVAQATANALQSIRATLCGQYPDLTGMIHYGSLENNAIFRPENNFFFDAGDFISRYAAAEAYQQWRQALDQAVILKRIGYIWQTGKNWRIFYSDFEMTAERFHGVSMFIPQDPAMGKYAKYNEDIKQLEWYDAVLR